MDLPAQAVADAPRAALPFIFIRCHHIACKASPVEREQIQEYLKAATLSPRTITPHEATVS